MMTRGSLNQPWTARSRGFTLIEAMIATAIVGIGVLSVMQLFTACTQQNRGAVKMTTGMLLAANIQETMAGLAFADPAYGKTYFGPEPGQSVASYDDIDDFDSKGIPANFFNPPIDSTRQPIAQLADYAQEVWVWPVDPNRLDGNTDPAAPEIGQTIYKDARRITVRILHRKDASSGWAEAYRTSWIRVAD